VEPQVDDRSFPFANRTNALAEELAHFDALDRIAGPTSRWVAGLLENPTLKDALSGTWLGHPVHPMLTDLPIGFWTSAFVLDFLGGKSSRRAAQRLVGLGILSAIPTAVTGAADWSDTDTRDKRVGVVHGVLNTAALLAFASSWRARHQRRHLRGVALGLLGGTLATVGAYLGGHLVDARGVGVAHTAFDPRPEEWTPVCQFSDVSEEPLRVSALGGTVIVAHVGPEIFAVSATCPHRGAPLDEGKTEAGTITCPWHGSCFRLSDGALLRGPSTVPLERYEVRVVDGTVEVRQPG
jgi:nitrite reductase/ring-hydroxylating ferredoxin subunit/uncharacterized membrane protein